MLAFPLCDNKTRIDDNLQGNPYTAPDSCLYVDSCAEQQFIATSPTIQSIAQPNFVHDDTFMFQCSLVFLVYT